jgi:hypothetical protein
MSDRPTPDTDERAVPHIGFYSCATVPAEFARQLERERDSLQIALKEISNLAKTLKGERDEAREGWDEEMKFHHRTHAELIDANCVMLDNQNDNRQLADRLTALELQSTSELARLEQERDEAREDRENSRQSLAFALEELDEARKEAHRFRLLHYSHLGINASASWFPWEEKLGHE